MSAGNIARPAPLPSIGGADWLVSASACAVFAAFARAGRPARAVGGCVRNTLMGEPVNDVDLATPATPEDVLRLARAAGLEVVPTGLEHGTVTVVSAHVPYEVTTLRRDVSTDGRRATVAFTDDWAQDARRRDFTMNALYADPDGTLHDPLGGYGDLTARRVRFIGEAEARIREDYLRILRFFRFHARYGAEDLDRAGAEACVRNRHGLATLSGERVRLEVLKILGAPRAVAAVGEMLDLGLLAATLGGVPYPATLARLAGIEARLRRAPDPLLRLAALAVRVGEDAERLAARLRLSGAERDRLARLAAPRERFSAAMDGAAARRALYRLGPAAYGDRALLDWAMAGGAEAGTASWSGLVDLAGHWTPPRLPIAGRDLVALGLPPGPAIGRALAVLEDAWLASDFGLDREALLALASATKPADRRP